jgi:hypothetical protein
VEDEFLKGPIECRTGKLDIQQSVRELVEKGKPNSDGSVLLKWFWLLQKLRQESVVQDDNGIEKTYLLDVAFGSTDSQKLADVLDSYFHTSCRSVQ